MKRKPKDPASIAITNCNFQGGPSADTTQAMTALANAAAENARAIRAIAEKLSGESIGLKIEQANPHV